MNLHIPLSPEAEAKLREQAMATGKDVDTFVLDVLQRTLSASIAPLPTTGDTSILRCHNGDSSDSPSELLGLFADEPELVDQIMESVYENRSRPLRIE